MRPILHRLASRKGQVRGNGHYRGNARRVVDRFRSTSYGLHGGCYGVLPTVMVVSDSLQVPRVAYEGDFTPRRNLRRTVVRGFLYSVYL